MTSIIDSMLYYFNYQKWIELCSVKNPSQTSNSWMNEAYSFKSINNKKPWIVVDDKYRITIINYNDNFKNASAKIKFLYDKEKLDIYDGFTYRDTTILLTNKGLYSYDVINDKLYKYKISFPDTNIRKICIDSHKRIWLGGNGLYRIDDFNNPVIKKISEVGNGEVVNIVADKINGGIVVSVRYRGIYIME